MEVSSSIETTLAAINEIEKILANLLRAFKESFDCILEITLN